MFGASKSPSGLYEDSEGSGGGSGGGEVELRLDGVKGISLTRFSLLLGSRRSINQFH